MGKNEPDFTLKKLDSFTGTIQYHSMVPLTTKIKVTDGIAYIMENGYGWLITDIIPLITLKEKLKSEKILVISLKEKKSTFTLIIKGKNNKELYKHRYNKYHDLGRELEIYYSDNVLMLPTEF